MRVAIDETAAEPGALAAGARRRGVPEAVAGCGGIGALLAQAALVPHDRRGAVHRLDARRSARDRRRRPLRGRAAAETPCGLATLELFEREGLEPRASGGEVPVPDGPGLGVNGAALVQ